MALIRPSSYWRNISPRGAIADFRVVFEQAGRNRWRFAIAAGAVTFALFSVMANEGGRGLPRPPEVTYINSWPVDRSEAEIIRSNRINQERKVQAAAAQAAREEEARQAYMALGRATGMDVDAIAARAKAERAAQKAKDDAETARVRAELERAALERK